MVKKIGQLFHQKNSIAGASLILIVTLFLSNVLGVIRDHYLTQKIPTDLLSSYYAAFTIPDTIFNILILGTMASAFIPIFTTLITQKKEKEAWIVASSVINLLIIFVIVSCLILAILMPYIIPLVVPGFDHERQLLTIKLARIMLASPILFGLSYAFGSMLNSFKRFFVYSLSPLIYNLAIIAGTLLFAQKYSVTGIALAVVAGAFLHLAIQLPVVLRLGFRWQPKIFWQHWGVRRIGVLMLPRAIALGGNQIMLLVFTAIASSLAGYSVASYNLANNIQTMPTVVFGTSFATAIFPTLAEAASSNRMRDFAGHVLKMSRAVLFFLIPISAIFILLRMEIVRLILGSGYFGWQQTVATANTLGFFSLSLVFSGVAALLARSFYALHNTKIPMVVTLIAALVSIVFGKIFSLKFGVSGLALGFSLGVFFSSVLMYLILRTKIKFEEEKSLFYFILKIVLATLIMSIAIQESKMLIGMIVNMQRFWGVAVKALIALGVGSGVYLLCCWIFGCEEISALKYLVLRFGRKEIENGSNIEQ